MVLRFDRAFESGVGAVAEHKIVFSDKKHPGVTDDIKHSP